MGEVLVVSLLVLASLRPASTEEKFIKEGGSVTLDLRPAPSDPITIIQWKFQDSILAEWVEDVLPLAHNREHIKLDIASGRLAMEKMTKAEEGVYSVEVNNLVQKVTYNVMFIKDVPKPDIWIAPLTCSHESDQCTLSCEGNTTGAEPITYSWKTGDGEWKESGKVMPITQEDHGHVKTFTCKMKNPVSEEESDPLPNRLLREMPLESSGVRYEAVLIKEVLNPAGSSWGCWRLGAGPWTEWRQLHLDVLLRDPEQRGRGFWCRMEVPDPRGEERAARMILFLPADSGSKCWAL
ncbi:SLAM family member 7-like [Gymnodraco acuticeps]|uniref:SLAM family member 7-like n=1 Tax=Gymnodraco acuticeps TaxID=8218 RepID=A0A6P8WYF0_GYMAC|nr:SLAM family member 7-like [Gymnodraco acuticeps]